MRGESMKDKSKKSTYSTTFGVDPNFAHKNNLKKIRQMDKLKLKATRVFMELSYLQANAVGKSKMQNK